MAFSPLITNAFPFLVSGTVYGSASLYTTFKQREQYAQTERDRNAIRREELEISHFQRLTELVRRLELEKATTLEIQSYREERDILLRTYPFEAGPGELAAAASLLFPDYDRRPRPIVILERTQGDRGGLWGNLHTEARAELDEMQQNGLLYAVVADRPVRWLNRRLWRHDLYNRPAIIVAPETGADRLHIMIGGCHLAATALPTDAALPTAVAPMTCMMTIEFRQSAELAKYAFTKQYNPDTNEATLVPVPRMNETDFNPLEAARDYVKLGATAIKMLVARLVDLYYLSHTHGYDPQFEPLVRRFAAQVSTAGQPSLVRDLPIPEAPEHLVLDLPYYRVTRPLDVVIDDEPTETMAAIVRALAALIRRDHPADPAAVLEHLRGLNPDTATTGRALRHAKMRLEGLPDNVEGKIELLVALNGAIARLEHAPDAPPTVAGPRPRWS